MKKSPNSQNNRKNPNKPKYLGFRAAILWVLTGLAVGGVIGYKLRKGDVDTKPPGIADKGGAQGGEGEPDDDDEHWPTNLVPSDEFDKTPEDYVNVDQCRELIFRVTGHRVAIGLEEIDEQCKELEKKRGEAAAEKIISDFCISNPKDMEEIRQSCLKGYTEYDMLVKGHRGGWILWLRNNENLDTNTIWLKEKPPCRPPLTTEEEERLKEDQKEEREIKEFKEGGFAEALDDVNIDNIRYEIHRENLGQDLEGVMEWAQKLKSLNSDSTQLERIQLGCKFLSFVFNLTEGGGLTPEAEERIDNNPVLSEFIEQLAEFGELLLESSGVEDFEECLLHIYGTSSQ